MTENTLPRVIQGGMGVAVSHWPLARAVSRMGQWGVVSGTALNRVMASRLADGDLGGHVRRALARFPAPRAVQEVLDRFYSPAGRPAAAPYALPPMHTLTPSPFLDRLTVVSSFVEVFLAKEGHKGGVGFNLLEKAQMPALASLYGAMLAGVNIVLMGAGIPTQIPGVITRLMTHQEVSYRVDVIGAGPEDEFRIAFNPAAVFEGEDVAGKTGPLGRPLFIPVISSTVLAQALLKRCQGPVDGFVVEGAIAGGHNAPPRGGGTLNGRGEPLYGPKDVPDLEKLRALGKPFWLAGGYGRPGRLKDALEAGAAGIQVGTAFALCDESGVEASLKNRLREAIFSGKGDVFTDPRISPTGFPFKVARLEGTLSEPEVYESRGRLCDMGILRQPYKKKDGGVGYRCPAEDPETYARKGGDLADTAGRGCLCNGLSATAGFAQRREGGWEEPPLLTLGDDATAMAQFLRQRGDGFSAADVVRALMEGSEEEKT